MVRGLRGFFFPLRCIAAAAADEPRDRTSCCHNNDDAARLAPATLNNVCNTDHVCSINDNDNDDDDDDR